jgi:predicted TIM-barrel fold metal-dependent hydrolase
MKIVAREEHFLSPDVRAAWAVASSAGQDGSESLHLGEIEERLEELSDARISKMDESGVSVQILSLTSPGLHNLQPAEGIAVARRTNDLIAATVAGRPDRFDGFATMPTTASGEAATELERCVRDLGLKGRMLFGRTLDKHLDHLDFLPIFETAAHLRVPLYIHPQTPSRAVREAYYSGFGPEIDLAFATFGLGWHYDCGIQFLRLVLAGVFDRFPDLQIILGHWGEVVLFYTERLKAFSRVAKIPQHPPSQLDMSRWAAQILDGARVQGYERPLRSSARRCCVSEGSSGENGHGSRGSENSDAEASKNEKESPGNFGFGRYRASGGTSYSAKYLKKLG